MIRAIIFSAIFLLSGASMAQEKKELSVTVDKNRLVNILGVVDARIINKANQLIKLAAHSQEPIYLFVNSPGGSVRAGNVFIDAMNLVKSRGVQLKCITSIYAASMAFSILANCSDRYVLPNARLLFHPARIGIMGAFTGPEYKELADILLSLDNTLQKFLVETMEIDKDVMLDAYYKEKWWGVEELQAETKTGWLTIVDDIVGIDNLFSFKPGKVQQSDVIHELNDQGYVIFNAKTN